MKEQIGIEYVCTGNGGRSPIAETLARDYVKGLELEKRISIFSSGTGASVLEADVFQFPVESLLQYVGIALDSGTYKGSAVPIATDIVARNDEIINAVNAGDTRAKELVEYCVRYLMADEVVKRNSVLLELGLVPRGHFHQQTQVREDVDLVLPMKKSNADYVRKLYAESSSGKSRSPLVVPVCEYAMVSGEISDPFGGSLDDFRKARDLIADVVKKSIDRAVEEYLR